MRVTTENNDSNTLFIHHGEIEITVSEPGVVLYKVHGPFNQELLERLNEIERDFLKTVKREFVNWCEIVIFHHSCLCVDQALVYLESYLKELSSNGLGARANAYVFTPEVEGSNIMRSCYRKCYENAGLLYEDFSHVDEAICWSKSILEASTK